MRRIDQAAEEKLTELDSAGLDLEELPPKIGKCTQLETLLLAKLDEKKGWFGLKMYGGWVGNKLTKFPEAVLQLTNLKILNLNGNKITSIPETIGQLSNLTELHLVNNKITSIPEVLGQLSNLRMLWLSDNQITSIPEVLGQLSNLRILWLNNNQLTSIPEALGQLSNLKLLVWDGLTAKIPKALRKLPKLKICD